MSHKPVANRALNALAHPVSIVSLLTLLLNAAYLQPKFPSALTGKLGDAAWMVIGPLLVCLMIGLILPKKRQPDDSHLIDAAAITFGLCFGLLKTIPQINALAHQVVETLFGFSLKLALDPGDLLVLPLIVLPIWVWRDSSRRNIAPVLKTAALGLALIAVVADAPAPETLGITCLMENGSTVTALRESYSLKDDTPLWTAYESTDGGVTWGYMSSLEDKDVTCGEEIAWPIDTSSDPQLAIYYLPGKGLYSSADGGQTLTLEYGLDGMAVSDTAVHPETGNIIFALGLNGVVTRTAQGEWVLTSTDLIGTTP